MRTIDADALKELFSEVIGRIAIKPEMNGNLEHMIRASAMVIQMIDDAPTVQPDTTVHDSIPAETGKNDDDGTSGDCISRAQAIDALKTDMASLDHIIKGMSAYDVRLDAYVSQRNQVDSDIDTISNLPPAQPEHKTGRWIESNPQDSKVCRLMTCSECGKAYIVNINIPYEDWTEAHKFCVECGADMRGKTE